ncbi:MAG: hypothetical protein Q8K78_14465 [Planctomycetaceae bacterium]|nr:hypothetical protein [Planctomycetaceae bacterium]
MSRALLFSLACLAGYLALSVEAADPPQAKTGVVETIYFPQPTSYEQRIQQALGERTQVAFTDTPLTDALSFLRDVHQINIIIDNAALQDEGVDPSSPINLELSGITFRSTLRLMLKPLQLAFIVEDEVLKITNEAKAKEALATRVYPVPDLASDADEIESVVEAIRIGVAASTWDAEGNHVGITGVAKSRSLVIRQTQAVHEEVEALLKNLRAAETHLNDFLQKNPVKEIAPIPVY